MVKHDYSIDRLGWVGLPHVSLHLMLDRCRGLWHLLSQPESCRRRQFRRELWQTVLYPALFLCQLYWWFAFSKAVGGSVLQPAPTGALKTDDY
jgi:hypothetical protein